MAGELLSLGFVDHHSIVEDEIGRLWIRSTVNDHAQDLFTDPKMLGLDYSRNGDITIPIVDLEKYKDKLNMIPV